MTLTEITNPNTNPNPYLSVTQYMGPQNYSSARWFYWFYLGPPRGGWQGGKLPRAPNSKGPPKLEGFSMGWF